MRKIVLCCVVLVASEARAEQEQDATLCLQTGGTVWDDAKSSPPRCTCPRGKVNAITAGGVCDKWSPNCDKCVEAGVRGHVRVVTQERVVAPSCEALCKAQGGAARWNQGAPENLRCEPTDPEQYLAGRCGVVAKPVAELTKAELCQTACAATEARWVGSAPASERCQPTDPAKSVAGPCGIAPRPAAPPPQIVRVEVPGERPPLFHLGGELRVLGLVVKDGGDGLYVPIGVAPSLMLRFDPWGPGKDLVLGVGPLITGNGGETESTPVGVALMAGTYWHNWGSVRERWGALGLEVDANWYAVDRSGEAYAFSLGGRAPVVRWQWQLRRGECHVSGGIGGAYLLPEEMAAFIWGVSGGCTTP